MEKKHSAERFIAGLSAEDGYLVTGQEDLYADLFSTSSVDAEAQVKLLSHFSSPLPSASCNTKESPLSMEECLVALQGMAHCKAPGSDSLPREFYLRFWGAVVPAPVPPSESTPASVPAPVPSPVPLSASVSTVPSTSVLSVVSPRSLPTVQSPVSVSTNFQVPVFPVSADVPVEEREIAMSTELSVPSCTFVQCFSCNSCS